MFLCYMDESGDPGKVGSPTPTYTVACVFVHDSQWVRLFEDILRFRRYLRQHFALRMRAEVKAAELVRGSGPWAKLQHGDRVRKRIYRACMRFQDKSGAVKTFAVVVDKPKCDDKAQVRECAWRHALERVERFANAKKDTVMLVPDSGNYQWLRKLSREMRRHSYVGSMLEPGGSLPRPLLRILIDDPVERDSRQSYFVQLADLNAYAAYRSERPDPLFPQGMWEELGDAILRDVNKFKRQETPGIVRGPR
jgi:hypothetical protein